MPRAIELIEKDFHSIDLREKKNQERVRRLKYRPIPVWEEAILNVQESGFAENTITLPHMQREPTIVENKGKVGQKWRTDFDLKGASHSESMRSNIRVKNLNEESVEITKCIGMQRPAAILHCGLLDGLSGNENKNSKLSSQEIDEVALPLVQFTEVTLPELNNQNGTPNCSFESSHRASNFHDIQHSLRSVEKCETYRNRIVSKSKEDHLESVSNLKSDEQTWNGTERVGGARNAKPTSEAMKQTVKRPFSSVTYRHREQLIPLHLFVSVPQNPTAAKNKDSFTSRSPVPPQGINENPKKSSRENKLNRGRLNLIKSNFSLNFSNLDMKFVTINNPIARTNKRKTNLELRPTLENSVFSWESARLSLNTRRPQSTHG